MKAIILNPAGGEVDKLYQYDKGCKIRTYIKDAEAVIVDYSCTGMSESATVQAVNRHDDCYEAIVPNYVLEYGNAIKIYVGYQSIDNRQIVETADLPVERRTKPVGFLSENPDVILNAQTLDEKKIDRAQGEENAGKVLVVGSDGNVTIGDMAEGAKGEKGDKGDPGPQGEKGETGAIGLQGPKGDPGETGNTGPQGLKGDPGEKGETGAVGPQGPAGETGPQGLQGEKGEKGDKGDPGETGAVGPQGEQGIQGIQGPAGATGPQGLQGETGPAGKDGADGKSAYDLAKSAGYTGTEEDLSAKLSSLLSKDEITTLIDEKLGVVADGSY